MQRDDIEVDLFHREVLQIDRLSARPIRYVCAVKWSCCATQMPTARSVSSRSILTVQVAFTKSAGLSGRTRGYNVPASARCTVGNCCAPVLRTPGPLQSARARPKL